ncbi:PD40 domain-containing protein [Lusitaniella coriacea LEGE 07157]|uniref:PD40 domain-containing protein n=1 Tax=Lusitaniella coriacea LEGE 07157 TaxID=945747 RepID=A0A8J7E2K8_9CYAN|nr:PD40 domain-containing protein [Lusitaniella coriacea LEGE 07157]
MHQSLKVWGLLSCIVLLGCQDGGSITPPPQNLGTSLNTKTAEQSPHLNYSGRYLAFASDRHTARGIFVYDLQRRSFLPLPGLNQPGVYHDQPDISADGRYIVYLSEQGGKTDVLVYDRARSRTENLTKNKVGQVRSPTISGNGRFVAFETNRSGQWDIELYDRGVGIDLSLPQAQPNPKSD